MVDSLLGYIINSLNIKIKEYIYLKLLK